MQVKYFQVKGPMLFDIDAYNDHRGTFLEAFNESKMAPYIKEKFKQDNVSYSNKNVVRGLHYQEKSPQGKLMYCLKGKILDVAVDIREGSSTFGQHVSVILDAEKGQQAFYVPPGFAHGFAVDDSSDAIILYKCTTLYEKEFDRVLSWNSVGIDLPKNFLGKDGMVMSEKDLNGTPLSQTKGVLV